MLTNGTVVYSARPGLRLWAGFCLTLGLASLVLCGVELLALYLNLPAATAILTEPVPGKLPAWGLVFMAAFIAGLGFSWYGLRRLKLALVVSMKGLEYHGPDQDIHVLWRDVERYGPVEWGGFVPAEGLQLRHRTNREGIPLELFAANWPLSPLGATIHHYLPRLTSPPTAPPAPAPRVPVVSLPPRRRYHRIPKAPASPPSPVARPAITRRLRPLRPSDVAVPGEWQGLVTGRLEEHDGDTVRF